MVCIIAVLAVILYKYIAFCHQLLLVRHDAQRRLIDVCLVYWLKFVI